jgi:hypothetical protein
MAFLRIRMLEEFTLHKSHKTHIHHARLGPIRWPIDERDPDPIDSVVEPSTVLTIVVAKKMWLFAKQHSLSDLLSVTPIKHH